MAEVAPLTSAHMHARKAAEDTHQILWDQAADEHQRAASDFAKAARSTSDSEALRVLKLLEEEHLKLARIIKDQAAPDQVDVASTDAGQTDPTVARHDFAATDKPTSSTSPKSKSTTSALAATRFGSQVRESSPSLARDIASRRGIPQPRNPPSAAAQARARQLSPESHRRKRSGPAPKIPPSVMDSQNLMRERRAKETEDDAFSKFYNTLTSGAASRLNSALAYAGLPLAAEEALPEPSSKQKVTKNTVSASNEPDVKKIFSKAALSAIEDEHRQRGNQGGAFGPAESFYLVQTGGGTYSYADITKPKQQQLGGIDEDDEDSFVDAREAQAPASPRKSRLTSQRGSFGKSTLEELELQNTILKTTLQEMANRLAEFETHAQDASMAALTQSMASLHNGGVGPGVPDMAMHERMMLLERQLEQQAEERQKLQTIAAKQEKSLKAYKSKWEEIRKSAKEKERAKKEKFEKEGEEASVSAAEGS